jgi:acetyl esterase/lipase
LFLGLCLITSLSEAQDKSKYYTVMHPDEFTIDWTGFYDKIDKMTAETRKELPHHLDLAYGDHPKQKLDLYLPEEKPEDAPVFLFLHGGGFREGDRAHYGYIARPFAQNGILTAVASYRLTVQGFHFPDQPEDVENAVAWLYKNIKNYGGDPERIYIGGHSAGAILSSFVGARSNWLGKKGLPAGLIKGCVPISGPYDLRVGAYQERQGQADAYVADADLRAKASPLVNVSSGPPRMVVAVGSVEEKYVSSSRQFVEKLKEMGGQAELLVLQGQDHADTALSLGDEKSKLFQAVLGIIKTN